MSRLLVFGAGGHGKVVADVARSAGYEVVGFVDDSPARDGTRLGGLPVTTLANLQRGTDAPLTFALGIGDNLAREGCHGRLRAAGHLVRTVIHASASVAPSASLGEGTVVMANASVNPDATVGEGCIVNTGAVVEHDCALGAYAHLSPNAALGGGASLGARVHVGLGAVVLPGMRIGDDTRVGAGAAVVRNVPAGRTVVGVPAREVDKKGLEP